MEVFEKYLPVMPRKVLLISVISRIIIIGLQVIFNGFITDHDPKVFKKPDVGEPSNELERVFTFLLEGLQRWDGHHFLTVAEQGYEYEKSLAFFPLFPFLTHTLANTLFLPLQSFINCHLTLLTAAVTLNFILFNLSVLIYYELSRVVLNDQQKAYRAAILFCFNPASVFFSAAYSESLYSCSTFAAMLLLQKRKYTFSTLLFALGTFTRSNGTANAGFPIYSQAVLPLLTRWVYDLNVHLSIISAISQAGIIIAPFFVFQWYAYQLFCTMNFASNVSESAVRLSLENPSEFVIPGRDTPWCNYRYPIPYAYVQSYYWDVGFMKYYHWKQIPNFLLAAPAILLCFHGIFKFAIRMLKTLNSEETTVRQSNFELLPYIVQLCFLLVFGITSMHVQVVTRLLTSSSPALCWFAAELLPDIFNRRYKLKTKKIDVQIIPFPLLWYWKHWGTLKFRGKLVLVYFFTYSVIGTAAFANNYPWT
ncbi:hypothetical protein CHUAL_004809 [Chamberlinius hualienensis]